MLPWLLGFPPLAFPTTMSSLTSPQSVSRQSTAALALGLLHNPKLQLPAAAPSGRPMLLSGVCMDETLILNPFRLPQISCLTLSLKCSSPDSDNCPDVGIGPLLQFPHPPKAGPVLRTLLFFPLVPSSYQVFCGSLHSFPLVRNSCPLSEGVMHAVLCLKVHS